VNGGVHVIAVGIAAPGLPDWHSAQTVLSGAAPYVETALPPYTPSLLPPNERRRAPPAVRHAFRAAEDALKAAPGTAGGLATVFASSDADMDIIHRICLALSAPAPAISPTDFHNSVHNAAAGYWSIAASARGPSDTLSAYDGSFAAGLLQAAARVSVDDIDTLLVAYDVPPPVPLDAARSIRSTVSVALILSSRADRSIGGLQLECNVRGGLATMADAGLEALRLSNPAARALPLLRLLALRQSGTVLLETSGEHHLRVQASA